MVFLCRCFARGLKEKTGHDMYSRESDIFKGELFVHPFFSFVVSVMYLFAAAHVVFGKTKSLIFFEILLFS